jgi:putative oxidoreductase
MAIPRPSPIDHPALGPDLGLLVLRLGAGALMVSGHGLPKLAGFAEKSATFSDPLGVSPAVSLGLAVFAEFFCALAVSLGLYARLASIPLVFTMGVAALVVHADDPFKVKEKALLFLVMYLAVLVAGPGKYALSRVFSSRRP